ncbi:peptide/nickel transport system ATP-binding protein [Neorhizobium galegae]|uniref:dipeptide ABC transporter ATP-binding protein n=1 Tax=Neorhizobium galegae TaxID=399 RepID=UPI002784818D|nr:ABC transporter ATP-binding protein [Neorhizobium galegae]MDQ0134368.1 peptide/nickel transport system ATP-binding protein [Neorhizobium galegae]
MNPETSRPLLDVRDLRVTTSNGHPILHDVSFDVEAGSIAALVGESGSGKTVAARAAMRLLPKAIMPVSGKILFEGNDVLKMTGGEIRKVRGAEIGMVFQEPMVSLNPAMTIGAQLVEGLQLHEKLGVEAARARASEMLERVKIPNPEACLAAFPHQFSGGMRQRIMLASVMLLRPKLLIADEPTTALDTLTQREVMEVMVDLTRTFGTSVLLITHNLGLVAQYAKKVFVLERGRLIESGPVEEVLHRPKEQYTRTLIDALPKRDHGRTPPAQAEPLIEARGVEVTFSGAGNMFSTAEKKLAVRGVSLGVRPGEVVAVVGGSGSGKTTLGRAMLGLLPLSGGDILFRGRPMASADRAAARDYRLQCQLVFQDPYSSLDPRQKIAEIVGEPLVHGPKLSGPEKAERVSDILNEVGLAGLGDRYPHALSGGQRQRVAIARAVIRNPAFVVADEPVSALDMTIQKQVLDLFRKLQENHGFACLFISHDLGAVSRVADRIVVMQQGLVVEEGSVGQILDHPQHPYTQALLEATPTLGVAA